MKLADEASRLNLRARHRPSRRDVRLRHPLHRLPPILLLTDEQRLADPIAAVARLPRGAAVILRHYGRAPDERAALARRLRHVTRLRGIRLLVAEDGRFGDLVRASGADGVHLPEWLLRRGPWRALRGRKPGWLVTAAAHSRPALRLAEKWDVDAVLLSPVFATASHPGVRPLGILWFAAWARSSKRPVYALGGISRHTVRRLRVTDACGVAGIGGLAGPPD